MPPKIYEQEMEKTFVLPSIKNVDLVGNLIITLSDTVIF